MSGSSFWIVYVVFYIILIGVPLTLAALGIPWAYRRARRGGRDGKPL